jgi:5-methyltetrahydropteroyltriglutamate--homocysteine methyltransferase
MIHLFPASVVGSMPRSDFVRDLVADQGTMDPEATRQRMDAAVRYVVALQERAGLDVVTDGEWRRGSYIGVIAELAHGFEIGRFPDGRAQTVVTGRLAPRAPGFIAEEIRFLRGITDRKVKATLPAPALLGERLWDPEKSTAAYPTREAFVAACVPILRREVELIRDAGADIIQVDDPHLCLFVDPDVRVQYEDPDKAADFAVDMVNQMIDGIDGVHLALHLCRRAGARARGERRHTGGYEPILDQLNRLKVHHLTMEFTTPGAGEFSVLKGLREDLEVGLGCIDVTPGRVDSVDEVVERIKGATQRIAVERITLNPDCGFSPGSGAAVDMDEVYEKLKVEVAAARILRREFA